MMQQTELVDFIDIIYSQEKYPTYAEEHQDFPVKFQSAFSDKARGAYKVTHGPVICRDFLGDVAVSLKYGNSSSIYGFSVDIPNQKGASYRNELSMLLTFPDAQFKKNFELNVNPVLICFGIALSYSIVNSLNLPNNQLIVNFGRNISPVGLSLLTWLFKIAAKPLQDNPDIVRSIEIRDLQSFLKLYAENFPGKEASYIQRVSLETFMFFVPGIIEYAIGPYGFTYLDSKKDQISFVHNCTGFFSQFCDKAYDPDNLILRRIFGTFAKALNVPVTYNFTPLSVEQLYKYIPSGRGLIIAGRSATITEEGVIAFREKSFLNPLAEKLKAQPVVDEGMEWSMAAPQEQEPSEDVEESDHFDEDDHDEAGEAW